MKQETNPSTNQGHEANTMLAAGAVFICGCGCNAHDHKCNEDASILLLSDGQRVPDTAENWIKHQRQITGGSVACSICGHAAIDDAHWM